MADRSIKANGILLHYLDHAGSAGPLVLLHGLSANAHSFDALAAAGLSPTFRVLAPDLRGRGGSEKPPNGYAIEDHAADIVAWLGEIGARDAFLGGHSYGGFLAAYIARHHPALVRRLVLLDIAHTAPRNPRVGELLRPSLARLGRSWTSRPEFIADMANEPSLQGRWTAAVEAYFHTDVEEQPDGRIRCRTRPEAVSEAVRDGARLDWPDVLAHVRQPTLLLYAVDPYGNAQATPLVLPEEAAATAAAMPCCRCEPVPGNHLTMLFEEGASRSAAAIAAFLAARS